jgi:tRNA threonylcarbamoyladenosine biosynthesis protein TsaE
VGRKLIREWKKVQRTDLPYIVYELKELVKTPSLVLLEGPVGAGKTTFTQHFVGDAAASPTYSVLSEYRQILHADFYRLEQQEEVLQLEIPLYLEDKQWLLVEWGEKFARRLLRDLPEAWTPYVLDIAITKGAPEGEEAPRNFSLSSFHED